MSEAKKNNPSKTNPMVKWVIVHILVIGALVAGLLILTKMPKGGNDGADYTDTVIYHVRHAEKITGEDAGRDPALTEEGEARAKILAGLLRKKDITHIYSSDYIRTRDTAAPTSEMSGVTIEIYDPRALDALAAELKQIKGRVLVVGHSNTVPETVDAIGGVGGAPIFEKAEYDRLYVVTISEGGIVQTNLRRYGTPYVAADHKKNKENQAEESGSKKSSEQKKTKE